MMTMWENQFQKVMERKKFDFIVGWHLLYKPLSIDIWWVFYFAYFTYRQERINPYQNGNLDLISLLKTYKLYLQTLSQCSTRNDTINSNQPSPPSEDKGDKGAAVSDNIASLSKQMLQEQRSQIKSLSSMKAALQLQLQDINESIGKVRKECR